MTGLIPILAGTLSLAPPADVRDTPPAPPIAEASGAVLQQHARREAARMLGALVYTDLSVQYVQTPAREALESLAAMTGVTLRVRYDDDRPGLGGLDGELPITLFLDDTPALTVLERVLDQCGDIEPCTWQIRRGFLEVGTKQRLAAPPARRREIYPIQDLLHQPRDFDNRPEFNLAEALAQGRTTGGGGGDAGGGTLPRGTMIWDPPGDEPPAPEAEQLANEIITLIRRTIEPDAWVYDGPGTATMRHLEGSLIIDAPDYIHRQVGGYPFKLRPPAADLARRVVIFGSGETVITLDE